MFGQEFDSPRLHALPPLYLQWRLFYAINGMGSVQLVYTIDLVYINVDFQLQRLRVKHYYENVFALFFRVNTCRSFEL
jgi:hypothetical protein